MDSVNSTTFIKRPPRMSQKEERLLYIKDILTNRLFLGYYRERRYVSVINEYRDVVEISDEETELHRDLVKVRKNLLDVEDIKWVGITNPGEISTLKAYCFWVHLSNLAFGLYWFQIRRVRLVKDEIILQLKCIRRCSGSQTLNTSIVEQKFLSNRNENADTSTAESTVKDLISQLEPKKAINLAWLKINEAVQIVGPYLTWENLFAIFRIIGVVLIAAAWACVSSVRGLGEFLLKFTRELTLLIQALTPIVIQVIDFFTKVVGGLYILILGLVNKNTPHQPAYTSNNGMVTYSSSSLQYPNPPIEYPDANWRERNRMLRKEIYLIRK